MFFKTVSLTLCFPSKSLFGENFDAIFKSKQPDCKSMTQDQDTDAELEETRDVAAELPSARAVSTPASESSPRPSVLEAERPASARSSSVVESRLGKCQLF